MSRSDLSGELELLNKRRQELLEDEDYDYEMALHNFIISTIEEPNVVMDARLAVYVDVMDAKLQTETKLLDDLYKSHDEQFKPAEIPAPQATQSKTLTKAQKKELAAREKEEAAGSKQVYNGLKSSYGKLTGGPMSSGDSQSVVQLMNSTWGQKTWLEKKTNGLTQRQLYEAAVKGDYSNFESLDNVLACYLASLHIQKLMTHPDGTFNEGNNPSAYANSLVKRNKNGSSDLSGLLNPLFRLGLSLVGHGDGPAADYCKKVDEACSTVIMTHTLSKVVSQQEKDDLAAQRGVSPDVIESEVGRSYASQIFMAKNMLLLHMANFKLLNADDTQGRWNHDMTAALTHCSRVSFILPELTKENAQDLKNFDANMRETVYAPEGRPELKQSTGLYRRWGSTHGLRRRKVNGGKEYKEQKKLFNPFGQYGMNVAVGGYGNDGIGTQISNNGSCGHVYTMSKESTATKHGAYLLGFESDAPGVQNQLGHTHKTGNGERCSSFGGQRVDELGKKYGGRVADLSTLRLWDVNTHMKTLEEFMTLALSKNIDISEEMAQLTGKKMDWSSYYGFIMRIERRIDQLS